LFTHGQSCRTIQSDTLLEEFYPEFLEDAQKDLIGHVEQTYRHLERPSSQAGDGKEMVSCCEGDQVVYRPKGAFLYLTMGKTAKMTKGADL